jgi:hypothetical protein
MMQISKRYKIAKNASKKLFAKSSKSLCPAFWCYRALPGVDRMASTPGAAPICASKKNLDVVFALASVCVYQKEYRSVCPFV